MVGGGAGGGCASSVVVRVVVVMGAATWASGSWLNQEVTIERLTCDHFDLSSRR